MFRSKLLHSINKAILERNNVLALWVYHTLNYKCGWREEEIYEFIYEQTGIHQNMWEKLLKNIQ